MIAAHNAGAAALWSHGAGAYDDISFGLADGIVHAVQALAPKAGEHILDIGTGTGFASRFIARKGARVTGIDIADGMIAQAVALSGHLDPAPSYQVADAEDLPLEDASVDGVISTYGVIFAGDPGRAAAEIARVLKPGGRMVLMTWAPDPESYIPRFFSTIGAFSDAPPPASSPMLWGDAGWVGDLFAPAITTVCTPHTTTYFAPDGDAVWETYYDGFPPVKATADALDPPRRAAFRQAFIDLHTPYDTGDGLRIDRAAVMVSGRKA